MPERDVGTIRDPICFQYATIGAKSAFAASDGESRPKLRGDKKPHDSIPPLLHNCSGTFDIGDPTSHPSFACRERIEAKTFSKLPPGRPLFRRGYCLVGYFL